MGRINKDEISRFHDCSLYLPTRTIYLGSEAMEDDGESGIDAYAAATQIKNLHILDSISKDPITIILNSPGGDVSHGLAIYDAIVACESHITVKVFGDAASMASIVLQAADERIMAPNAVQMIHYGSLGIDKPEKIVYKHIEEAKRVDKWMEKMYLERIKQKNPLFKLGRLQRMLDHDTFLTAKQSVELGLADKVLGEE